MEKTVSTSCFIISSFLREQRKEILRNEQNYFTIVILINLIISVMVSSALLQEGINKSICQTNQCLLIAKNLKESIKTDESPCDNFYQYACGNWPKDHKNKNNMPQSTFGLRNEENYLEILDFLQQNNTPNEPESFHKARKLLSLCLNESAYIGGTEPVEYILKLIGVRVTPFTEEMYENFDYAKALARAIKLAGVRIYFSVGVVPNLYNRSMNAIGLRTPDATGMDDTDMPFRRRPHTITKRSLGNVPIYNRGFIYEVVKKMCKNSTSMACTSGNPYMSTPHDWVIDQIENQSYELSEFMETWIISPNSNTMPENLSLYQLQSLSDNIANEVNATIPKLNWTRYIQEMFTDLDNVTLDLSNPAKVPIVIENLNFLQKTLKFMYSKRTDVGSIEWDIWWNIVSTLLPYSDLNTFDMKNKMNNFDEYVTNSDLVNRKHTCDAITIASFGLAINYGYSTKEKYINAKTKIAKMLEHVRGVLEHMIKKAFWMDEKTRQRAIIKLKSLKSNIVYPSTTNGTSSVDDYYRDVQINNNFFDTMVSKIQKQIKKSLNTLNQLNDLNEEYWPPLNVANGFYYGCRNTMMIPASIVGGSIYTDSLRAWDYGAIGSILGHELNHAFDDMGRQFNEIGNIENWWQNETLNSYRGIVKCFAEDYANNSVSFNGYTIKVSNSTENSDEDISDNGAFKESLLAYRRSVSELGEEPFLPQFHNVTHEQLLTLAFANVFCENPTTESISWSNNHSPNGVRVNGVLQNSKEFSEIWNCPKGSKMNPSDKCSIW